MTYVETEVAKIIEDKKFEFPKNIAMAAAWILGNFKGLNLKVFDVRGKSSLTDFFVIASATNTTQSSSMADAIVGIFKRHDINPISREGLSGDAEWTLLDFGDVIIHIFQDNAREFYNIEEMLKDGVNVQIPNEYYYSNETDLGDVKLNDDDDDESYF